MDFRYLFGYNAVMTTIHQLPRRKRPRERLRHEGPEALSLPELVAVLLGSGTAGRPVIELARQVADALSQEGFNYQDLIEIPGIGSGKAALIAAALRLSDAVLECRSAQQWMDPAEIARRCEDLSAFRQEHLVAFFFDSRMRQIRRETITIGTVSASLVHPREVFRPAIEAAASHVIVAHNHPTGNVEPSPADLQATSALARAGSHIGIELVDHVICARGQYRSLRASLPDLFLFSP